MLRELTGSTRGLFSLSLFSGWGIGVWCGPGCGGAWVGFCWHGSPCTPLPDPPHPPQSGRTSCQTTSPNTPLDPRMRTRTLKKGRKGRVSLSAGLGPGQHVGELVVSVGRPRGIRTSVRPPEWVLRGLLSWGELLGGLGQDPGPG